MNAYVLFFKIDSVRRIDYVIDYFGDEEADPRLTALGWSLHSRRAGDRQQENGLSILLAQNPGPIPRGLALAGQPQPPEIPAGLPSSLLERRPDIRQSEQSLVAANAQIGVAKAAYFPAISLTGSGGVQSFALSSLFTDPAGFWSIAGSLVQPIFTAGRIGANVRLTEAQAEELVNRVQLYLALGGG